ETGRVSFIGNGNPIHVPGVSDIKGMAVQERGMEMARIYGKEFGLKNPSQELKLLKSNKDHNGKDIVRYQQIYKEVPVLAAEMIVDMNSSGELLSISGEVSSDLVLDTKPTIKAEEARKTALAEMADVHGIAVQELAATVPELWIFDESLLTSSTRPVELVWRMEVKAKDGNQPIREMVLVNAQTGELSFHVNQVDTMETVRTNKRSDIQQVSLPLYFDLVADEARGWIYGSDSAGNKVDVIDRASLQLVKSFILVNGASPKGMDFNPVSDELAVAQNGGGSVIFIDPDTGATNTAITGGKPYDVIYGRTGRLYSVGSGGTYDYVHIIDSVAHT
ncbi:MAG TPA: hypothetical protein VJQ25_05400, partial [Nitrospira sp.]|nr:hypothetical protein [Nitrospira sp.]